MYLKTILSFINKVWILRDKKADIVRKLKTGMGKKQELCPIRRN